MYDEPNLYTAQRNQQNPPFVQTISNTPVNAPLSLTNPWSGGTTPTNPFPLPFKPTASTPFYASTQYIVLPKHFKSPYVMQFTASVQQELGHGWQIMLD